MLATAEVFFKLKTMLAVSSEELVRWTFRYTVGRGKTAGDWRT